MKRFIFLVLFIFTCSARSTEILSVQPQPGSLYNSPQTGLLFKLGPASDPVRDHFSVRVLGKKSGMRDGALEHYDNILRYTPNRPFTTNEKVMVTVYKNGKRITGYTFYTGSISAYDPAVTMRDADAIRAPVPTGIDKTMGDVRTINGVSVPYDFPGLLISTHQPDASTGRLFLANWVGRPYLLIYDKDGTPYFYKRLPEHVRDFKLQPTGYLTYRHRTDAGVVSFIVLDSTFTKIDTLRCANGYQTDQHEVTYTDDGHYFLIALGYHRENMSRYVDGGKTNANVIDNHIQEFNRDGQLVFEWKCHNHFRVQDATHENLKHARIDYIHLNSIDVDYDGHLVISSRHQSEVAKIDRQTGQTIWRLGGVNNEFTFINDHHGLSYQHDARAVPGKPNHYTIFDNGNYHDPPFSRGIEYKIDPLNYTATKVWEYRASPDLFAVRMGNLQRLPNGGSIINWAEQGMPKFTEVTSQGRVVYEADIAQSEPCYRTFQFPWENILAKPSLIVDALPDKVCCVFNKFGDKNIEKYIVYKGKKSNHLAPSDTVHGTFRNYSDLDNFSNYYFSVQAVDSLGRKSMFSDTVQTLVRYIPSGENMVSNGDFNDGKQAWQVKINDNNVKVDTYVNSKGEYQVDLFKSSQSISDVQLIQENIGLIEGVEYLLEFDAYAFDSRVIEARLMSAVSSNVDYSRIGPTYLTNKRKHYSYDFIMKRATDYSAQLVFNCARYSTDFCLDNISLVEIVDSSVARKSGTRPDRYLMHQNYPNPFNPATTIRIEVPEISRIQLTVYNLLGKRVAEIADLAFHAGVHHIPFDASDLASGVYFYRMDATCIKSKRDFLDVKKMMVMK